MSSPARYHGVCDRERRRPPAPGPNPGNPGPPAPQPPRMGDDCVSFNPHRLHVEKRGHAFYLIDGPNQVANFGRKAGEADRALEVIKYHRMNQLFFVDRTVPSFRYLLTSGRATSGGLAGQDCVSFNPMRLRVRKTNGSYEIVDGGHYLSTSVAIKRRQSALWKLSGSMESGSPVSWDGQTQVSANCCAKQNKKAPGHVVRSLLLLDSLLARRPPACGHFAYLNSSNAISGNRRSRFWHFSRNSRSPPVMALPRPGRGPFSPGGRSRSHAR